MHGIEAAMSAGTDAVQGQPRYAVYYRPPEGTPIAALADRWLGRQPEGGDPPAPPPEGLDATAWRGWTEAPRLYGFHATLKPPFKLAKGTSRRNLLDALTLFAEGRARFSSRPLEIRRIGRFLALSTSAPDPALDDLAASCVEAFDRFRRPADNGELARRRARGLTARQEALLERWGYPYVMSEFRFHMTLTGALAPDEIESAEAFLALYFADCLGRALPVVDICLFEQPSAGTPFRMIERFPFRGAA